MSTSLLAGVFFLEIVAIFFLSRIALKKSYFSLHRILKKDKWIIVLVALAYFPGTFIHELSHYVVALILNLHPREMHLFPVVEGNRVKLGHVLYERHPHDFIRSILVGVAPFMGGLFSVWLIVQTKLFPGTVWWQSLLFGYLILAITANMFSSRQDLIDVGYLIPIGIFIMVVLYLFPVHINPGFVDQFAGHFSFFIRTVQIPLLFSLAIHAILIALLSIGR